MNSPAKHRYQVALPFILLCLIFFLVSMFNRPKRTLYQDGSNNEVKSCMYADCSTQESEN
jgi:hypothetical protein